MRDPSAGFEGIVVHPTAIVHPSVRLEDGVEIGAYAVVGANAVIGAGTVIGPHSVIHDNVELGRDNQLAAHVVAGGRPQDRTYRGEPTRVVIGDGNRFSEFCSIERATGEGSETRIGDRNFIMSSVRVSHNCVVGSDTTIVSGAQLGGWVHVGDQAYLGGLSGVHQFVRIGRLVMLAGLSGARQDVPPFVMAAGLMARAVGLNRVGLQRQGVPPAHRLVLQRVFRQFFRERRTMEEALRAIEAEAADSPVAQEFLAFIRSARERTRGIVRWQPRAES